MRGSLGELNPSRAVAKRMHELETELQQARMHLRRHSKSPDTTGRWGLEQPSAPEQEESWFITYLDMMTLLLVVMIVMLAFSGAIGARAGDEADTARPVASASATPAAVATAPVATALVGTTPPDTAAEPGASEDAAAPPSASVSADGTSASGSSTSGNTGARPDTGRSTVSPNAANRPPESSAAAADTATPRTSPGGTGLLPAGSGLLPGSSTLPNTAAVSETLPGWSAPQSATTALAHPADIGPLPRNAQPTPAGRPDSPLSTPAANSDESLYPGWSAADLAASFIGPPRPTSLSGQSEQLRAASPSNESEPAEDPLSQGEMLAADLALGELGSDVEVIISERSVSFRVNSEILFDSSQSDLSRSGLAVLRNIVNVLTRAGYDVTVEGHTDSVPVRRNVRFPSNWELSSARAGSVVRYLQANGIDRSRLKAVGYADTRPIADNNTPDGRARNRRVELVIEKR